MVVLRIAVVIGRGKLYLSGGILYMSGHPHLILCQVIRISWKLFKPSIVWLRMTVHRTPVDGLIVVSPPEKERMTSWRGWRLLRTHGTKSVWRHVQAGNFCNFEESVSSLTPGFRVRILRPFEKENPKISTHHTTNTTFTHHVQPWPYVYSM